MSDSTQDIMVNGFWKNNGVFVQMLGMCPTLGVTTSAENGIGMGLATTAVLVGSNLVVSMVRKAVPNDVRIPAFIIIIASFVTIVDLSMNAFVHDLHKVLGLFIPLIVVNCIILGRAEAFASKNSILGSVLDGVFTGLGFTFALTLLGSVRELLGSGQWLGHQVLSADYQPVLGFILPPGAFIALGFILMTYKWINQRSAAKP
ncbi:MAG: electron transport complex subunit E [Magnetococcales bacterium]|nr:electron transport complex subunit E [Magnetococcales bacterium]